LASQREVHLKAVYQGGYDQTYSRALAAHFSGKGPHLVQVVEAGSASLLIWKGAIRPVWQVMADERLRLDPAALVPGVASAFADAAGRLLAMPFNTTTPILYYNKDAFRHAGLDAERPPRTWYEMASVLGALVDSGMTCGYVTAWPAWVLIENMSVWHNQEFATRGNGLGGADLWVFGAKKPAEYRAVAAFLAFLARPEVQARWHEKTGFLPLSLAAAALARKDGYYRRHQGQEIALRQLGAVPTPDSRGIRLGDYRWIRPILDEELEAVWARARTPKGALDAAVQRGNALLRGFADANRIAR